MFASRTTPSRLLRCATGVGRWCWVVGGLVGTFVRRAGPRVRRARHRELSFAGAAALLIGADVITGLLVGSHPRRPDHGFAGLRRAEGNSFVGVLMPLAGAGHPVLSLYEGRSSNKFSLLTGQIVSSPRVQLTSWSCSRRSWWSRSWVSGDPSPSRHRPPGGPGQGPAGAGALPSRSWCCWGITVALSVQIVGSLLVLALLITPAAAAMNLTVSPCARWCSRCSSRNWPWVGVLLTLGGNIPISHVTTISFTLWLVSAWCAPS
ncbi:metal ABC transporter permease [Kocuria rhizophila]|nr:metal ABC transporter permease [Kocuria rhizophila]